MVDLPIGAAMPAQKHRYYYSQIGDLKHRLTEVLPRAELKDLHRVDASRHFLVVARHLLLIGLCGYGLWQSHWRWLWLPAAFLQGFNILGFIILLHEQVHKVIFASPHPRLERLLGFLYSMPVGMSATQFATWHLDHHHELGHDEDDPKRKHLSPKKNQRWIKFLYCTPALFFIYSRASMREARTYDPALLRTIQRERLASMAFQALLITALIYSFGVAISLRVYLIPMLFFFPPAFVLNRLGQHYDIDPSDPAKWTTLVNGNRFWHFIFLWSNFHLEHHYYQRVPFYRLRRLNMKLQGFYRQAGLRNRTYLEMLWGWFVRNKTAHTDWDAPVAEPYASHANDEALV
jgi:fatty acid desaturase